MLYHVFLQILGLCLLLHCTAGHQNSVMNLQDNGMMLEEGGAESINAQWQCEPQTATVRRIAKLHKTHTPEIIFS